MKFLYPAYAFVHLIKLKSFWQTSMMEAHKKWNISDISEKISSDVEIDFTCTQQCRNHVIEICNWLRPFCLNQWFTWVKLIVFCVLPVSGSLLMKMSQLVHGCLLWMWIMKITEIYVIQHVNQHQLLYGTFRNVRVRRSLFIYMYKLRSNHVTFNIHNIPTFPPPQWHRFHAIIMCLFI